MATLGTHSMDRFPILLTVVIVWALAVPALSQSPETRVVLHEGDRSTVLARSLAASIGRVAMMRTAKELASFSSKDGNPGAMGLIAERLTRCGMKVTRISGSPRSAGGVAPNSVTARLEGGPDKQQIMVSAALKGNEAAAAVLLEVARVLGVSRRAHGEAKKRPGGLPPLKRSVTFAFWGAGPSSFEAWLRKDSRRASAFGDVLVATSMGRVRKGRPLRVAGPKNHAAIKELGTYKGAPGYWRAWERRPLADAFPGVTAHAIPRRILRKAPFVFYASYASDPGPVKGAARPLDAAELERQARALLVGILRLAR